MSLTRKDWLEGARTLMVEKGIAAVKVEVLARRLGVSKGSFYWHFKNRDDLLSDLLNYWASVTDELIRHGSQTPSAKDRLAHLFAAIAAAGTSGEEVIQVWAKHDENVAAVVQQVETKRINYLQAIFEQGGFESKAARERAEITYLAFLGYAFKRSQDSAFKLEFTDLGQEISNIMFERIKDA